MKPFVSIKNIKINMIDLLIINPGSKSNYEGMDDLKAIEPPVWAGMIAYEFRKVGGTVRILDANAMGLSPAEVAGRVAYIRPRGVLIVVCGHNPTASTTLMPAVIEICKEIRKADFNLTPYHISLFGVHPSALPERTKEETGADEVIPGMVNKNLTKEVSGVAWEMLAMPRYRAHNWHCFNADRKPYGMLYTSLGCPHKCYFCPVHANLKDRRHSVWSPEWVMKQIDILYRNYGVRNIKIADELFVMGHERVNKICHLIAERNYDLNMWAYGRVDYCPEKLLENMKKAGINWIGLGIESVDEKAKGYKKGDPEEAVRKYRDAGINVNANYIFGLPGDDMDSMQKTLDLAMKLNTEFANFYTCMAYPGSKLYDETDPEDLPDSWEGYAQYSYECKPLPTKHLSSAEVLKFRDEAFRTYFTNPSYLKMMEGKFGIETRKEIEGMKMKFERRILNGMV